MKNKKALGLLSLLLLSALLSGCGKMDLKKAAPDVKDYAITYLAPVGKAEIPAELADTVNGLLARFEGTVGLELPNFSSPDKLTPDQLVLTALAVTTKDGDLMPYFVTKVYETYRYDVPFALAENALKTVFGDAVSAETMKSSSYYQSESNVLAVPTWDLSFSNAKLIASCDSIQQTKDGWIIRLNWFRDISDEIDTIYITQSTAVYKLTATKSGYLLAAASDHIRFE